jgi:hypothetical protein
MNINQQVLADGERAMRTITIQTIQSGQPRPYADSYYEYKVNFTDESGKPWPMVAAAVIPPLKAICRQWMEPDESHFCWASPTLSFLKPIPGTEDKRFPGVAASGWHLLVTEAFTD